MSNIKVERNHALGDAEAKKRIESIEPKLKERYGVKLAWSGNQAKITGAGVSGQVEVGSDRLAIDLKLGMLVRPFATKIRESLERQVDKALG